MEAKAQLCPAEFNGKALRLIAAEVLQGDVFAAAVRHLEDDLELSHDAEQGLGRAWDVLSWASAPCSSASALATAPPREHG
ncbi:MAG: hypothetical protein U0176_00020 [Bacteroidia bacterium]